MLLLLFLYVSNQGQWRELLEKILEKFLEKSCALPCTLSRTSGGPLTPLCEPLLYGIMSMCYLWRNNCFDKKCVDTNFKVKDEAGESVRPASSDTCRSCFVQTEHHVSLFGPVSYFSCCFDISVPYKGNSFYTALPTSFSTSQPLVVTFHTLILSIASALEERHNSAIDTKA